jgi:hypothetical protein
MRATRARNISNRKDLSPDNDSSAESPKDGHAWRVRGYCSSVFVDLLMFGINYPLF